MRNGRKEAAKRLYEIVEDQQGFFTTKQAKAVGFAENTHPYHVQAGNWIREHRGIYRLASFPRLVASRRKTFLSSDAMSHPLVSASAKHAASPLPSVLRSSVYNFSSKSSASLLNQQPVIERLL